MQDNSRKIHLDMCPWVADDLEEMERKGGVWLSKASWRKGDLGSSLEEKHKVHVSVTVAVCISSVLYGVVYTGYAHKVHGTVVHMSSCKAQRNFLFGMLLW